jgi:hypothetical protein
MQTYRESEGWTALCGTRRETNRRQTSL